MVTSGRSHSKIRFWLLPLIFLLAFAARAVFPDTSYFFWDESVYLMHGQLFAGQEAGYSEVLLRPPLLPALLSPVALLQPPYAYELASKLLVAFLNALVVVPVYFLARFVVGRRSALIAASIAAFLPVSIINSRWIMTDALGAMLALSSVAAYLIGLKIRKGALICAGGFLAALAVLMKFTNILLFLLLLPMLLVRIRKDSKAIAASALVFAAAMLPYLIFSLISFGSPFYTFSRAFEAVSEPNPSTFSFFLSLLGDSLGILAIFLIIGVFGAVVLLRRPWQLLRKNADRLYLLYCLAVSLAYSLWVLGKGVARPPGIEWEAGRFLLLFLLFAAPFIAQGIALTVGFILALFRCSAAWGILASAASVSLIAGLFYLAPSLSLYPQLERAYAPAIAYEDGLREATKGMGVYLAASNLTAFSCLGNCPPVAYYSGKKMLMYRSAAELAAANPDAAVVFDSSNFDSSYSLAKQVCAGSHCAYLVKKR